MAFSCIYASWWKSCENRKYSSKNATFSLSIFTLAFLSNFFEVTSINQLTIMASTIKPFVVYHPNQSTLIGLDVKIIENFAKRFNCEAKFIMTNESLLEIFSSNNRTIHFLCSVKHLYELNQKHIQSDLRLISHGIYLFFRKIDIFIGALGENLITSKYLLASNSYYHRAFTWCVRKCQPIPVKENLLHLCRDPKVYALFTVTVVAVLGAAYILQIFDPPPHMDWHRIFVNEFPCILGFPCHYYPTSSPHRVLFAFFLLASTLFVILINSVAFSFITTPILQPQIKSIQEIVGNEFNLVGNRFVLMKLQQKTEVNTDNFSVLECNENSGN